MSSFVSGYTLPDFLIEGVNINTCGEFTGTFFAVLSAAIIYEGIKTIRDYLINNLVTSRSPKCDNSTNNGNSNNGENKIERGQSENSICMKTVSKSKNSDLVEYESEPGANNKKPSGCENDSVVKSSDTQSGVEIASNKRNETNNTRDTKFLVLLLSTGLHMLYVFLGYTLMLTVMTYNIWILAAVAIGVGIGYFLFDTFRRNDLMRRPDIINNWGSSQTRQRFNSTCNSEFSYQTAETTVKLD